MRWTCWRSSQADSCGRRQLLHVNMPGSGGGEISITACTVQENTEGSAAHGGGHRALFLVTVFGRLFGPLNIPDFTVLAPLSRTLGFLSASSCLILNPSSSSTWPDPDTLGDPRDLWRPEPFSSSSSSDSLLLFLLHSSTLCWTNLVRSARTNFFLQPPHVR